MGLPIFSENDENKIFFFKTTQEIFDWVKSQYLDVT
jgi:hypothetical protein